MKKMCISIFSLCVIFSALYMFAGPVGCAQAEELNLAKARGAIIAINSPDSKVDLKEIKSNGVILGGKDEYKNKWYTATLNLGEGDKWQELWIEFSPAQSGDVLVELRGPFFENSKNEIWVDDVKIEGEDLLVKNGGFETLDAAGVAIGWEQRPSKDLLSTDSSQARTGKNCALIWHERPLTQGIAVKAGGKYKISAWFKGYYK